MAPEPFLYTRRRFLIAPAGTAGLATAACTFGARRVVGPSAAEIGAAEARRRGASATARDFSLVASVSEIGLGSRRIRTWSYGGGGDVGYRSTS